MQACNEVSCTRGSRCQSLIHILYKKREIRQLAPLLNQISHPTCMSMMTQVQITHWGMYLVAGFPNEENKEIKSVIRFAQNAESEDMKLTPSWRSGRLLFDVRSDLDELGGCVSCIYIMIYIRLWEGNTYKSNGTSSNHSESGNLNVTSSTSSISNWGASTTWATNDTRGSRWGSNTGRNSSARWIGDSWGLAWGWSSGEAGWLASGNIWGCSGAVETGGAWASVDGDGPGIMC